MALHGRPFRAAVLVWLPATCGVADGPQSPVGLRCLTVRYHEQQPTFIPPMLLTSAGLPSGDAWTFELKWDGRRAQLRYDGRSVSLRTRNGRECGDTRRRAGLPKKRRAA